MKKLLVIIDMQKDFITGCLGNDMCRAVVSNVVEKAKHFDGDIVCTMDTHQDDYLNTQEGTLLPVKHCVKGTDGWQLIPELQVVNMLQSFEKNTFGSTDLAEWVRSRKDIYKEVEFVGVCTDICVISNAMVMKAFNPELKITVDASCCAGVTKQSHENALEAMKSCQILVHDSGE